MLTFIPFFKIEVLKVVHRGKNHSQHASEIYDTLNLSTGENYVLFDENGNLNVFLTRCLYKNLTLETYKVQG